MVGGVRGVELILEVAEPSVAELYASSYRRLVWSDPDPVEGVDQ